MIGILVDDLHRAEEGRLRRYFLRRLRNAADAADATQETFLRFLSAPQTTIIENPQAYLFQIAKSVASRTTMRASAEARRFLPAEAGLNEPTRRRRSGSSTAASVSSCSPGRSKNCRTAARKCSSSAACMAWPTARSRLGSASRATWWRSTSSRR